MNNKVELQGTVKVLMQKQTFDSGFEKREFVITTKEEYPQDVKFECIKEKISQLDGLNIGDEVTVAYNVRGNEYQGKYYVNLQAWKIERNSVGAEQKNVVINEPTVVVESDNDELPF